MAPFTRHDWTLDEIIAIHDLPLLDLISRANTVHREFHDVDDVQKASLLSIKTGGCPENCGYCPQSAHHKEVHLDRINMMATGRRAGRRRPGQGGRGGPFLHGRRLAQRARRREFDCVLDMVRGVRALGTGGLCHARHADRAAGARLKEAGLTAYNHNLDTGPEYYKKIVTTRTYEDRLDTLKAVRGAGIEMCCGGIVGMGESAKDRAGMLQVLAGFDPPPESVPINALVPVEGTPLGERSASIRSISCA